MKCIYCGCTDDRACPGGCHWASHDPPVCSECADLSGMLAAVAAEKAREKGVEITFGHFELLDVVCKQTEDRPRVQLDRWAFKADYPG